MADLMIHPLCALGGATAETHLIAGLTIAENPGVAMASVAARQGQDKAVAKAIKALAGLDLPGPGGMATAGDWAAFWLGPGQWMLTAPFASHEDIARIAKEAVGAAGSVTEQSDAWVRLEVSGPRICDMLERLCNADIRRMQAGQATRCQVEHLGTLLLCHQPGAAFSLLTLRSAARSMMHALVTAAKSLP